VPLAATISGVNTLMVAIVVGSIAIFWARMMGRAVLPAGVAARVARTRPARWAAARWSTGRAAFARARTRIAAAVPHRTRELDAAERVAAARKALKSLAALDPGLPLDYPSWLLRGALARNFTRWVAAAADLPAGELDGRPRVILADALSRLGRYPEALPLYDAAIEASPNDGDLHLSRGVARLQVRRFADALADLQASSRLGSMTVSSCAAMGDACWGLGRIDDALTAYARGLELRPGHPWLEARGAQAMAAARARADSTAVRAKDAD
jgi:tetratricopeptide (TPR) repeat protein